MTMVTEGAGQLYCRGQFIMLKEDFNTSSALEFSHIQSKCMSQYRAIPLVSTPLQCLFGYDSVRKHALD